jgi:hypothetical protein
MQERQAAQRLTSSSGTDSCRINTPPPCLQPLTEWHNQIQSNVIEPPKSEKKRFLRKKGVAKKGAGCRMFAGKGRQGNHVGRRPSHGSPHPAQLGGASFSRQNL